MSKKRKQVTVKSSLEERADALLLIATTASECVEHWTDLHNTIFGLGGKYAFWFPSRSDRVKFGKTPQHQAIMELISKIRQSKGDPESLSDAVRNANGAIALRVPTTVHAALLAEAEAEGVSLNQLILTKITLQLKAAA
ncbi:MAG: toxin-antitoxin system HicB family antitoxin [Planctomycetales bacterium]